MALTKKEEEFLKKISPDEFARKAIENWRRQGCYLIEGMNELILEEFNNEVIDELLGEAYGNGDLEED